MSLSFYHPNSRVTGFAASFWYSDRDDAVFATILKQSGWDTQTQNGTFKGSVSDPNKKVNIKLSFTEVAAILDCIDRGRPFTSFHDNEDKPKSISFSPWMTKGEVPKIQGYSFSTMVTDKQDSTSKNPFYIGLSFAEARELREFLIFTMHEHFRRITNYARVAREVQMPEVEKNASVVTETVPLQEPPVVNEPRTMNSQTNSTVKDPLIDF